MARPSSSNPAARKSRTLLRLDEREPFERSGELTVLVNRDSQICAANPALEHTPGYRRAELFGKFFTLQGIESSVAL